MKFVGEGCVILRVNVLREYASCSGIISRETEYPLGIKLSQMRGKSRTKSNLFIIVCEV